MRFSSKLALRRINVMSMKLSEKTIQYPLVYGLLDHPICLPAIFICGGNLRGKVYSNNPHTIEKLKMNIRNAFAITPTELAKVTRNMLSCVSKFMVNNFSTSCELLNVLHFVLNNNNVLYCTVVYSVFTLNK